MKQALDFDQVALVPQFNNVASRTEPKLDTWLTKNLRIGMPLLAANMDTVIGPELAKVLIENGGMPIFHRFAPLEAQLNWVKEFKQNCLVSCGLVSDIYKIGQLLDLGAAGVCVDIAHGHSLRMLKLIETLKVNFPKKEVIAGNVCTAIAYQDLCNAGADAVKVGIGPGAACTTRKVTGFGVPQFTAIQDCAEIAKKLKVPLIADGGIKGSREVVLALAAGASTVMIGSLFAATDESAAPNEGNLVRYRGQASRGFQEDFYGQVKGGTVPEGETLLLKRSGPAQGLIDDLLGGLRSGLTYGGARSIKEMQRKKEIVRV